MKMIVFGASGTIGRELVRQALEQGHQITAFVRNPQKVADLQHKNLRLYSGDVLDGTSVENAMPGHDAVFCALGAGRGDKVRAIGTKHILEAMEKNGIRRFIVQTTLGCGDSYGNLNFFWKRIMFGWFLKKAFLDHELQEQYILGSGVDWTIVRPGAFTDGPRTGRYRHGFAADARGLKLKISRADVADFMLRQLEDTTYLRRTPGLSY